MTVETAGICSSMRYTILVVLLLAFCNHLETVAQNESSSFQSFISPSPGSSPVEIMSATISLIPSVSEATTDMTVMINETASFNVLPTVLTIATSPDIIPVTSMDVFTMIDSSIIMGTSQLSIDTTTPEFTVTIATTVTSPVPTIDTYTSVIMSTNIVMEDSSVTPMTTAIMVTTSNPVPVPEGDSGGFSFSTGITVAIASGGAAALLVILILIVCCCCCCCCQRHHYQKDIDFPMSPTIQTRHEEYNWAYASQMSRASTCSQLSNISQLSKVLRESWRSRHKERKQFEGGTLISNTILSTPV